MVFITENFAGFHLITSVAKSLKYTNFSDCALISEPVC